MFHRFFLALFLLFAAQTAVAQLGPSMYGDRVKADVKVRYVYTLEEALLRARQEKKLVFFNCFADWAVPCHAMNLHVFSDSLFARYLNATFVPLIIDVSKPENKAIADRFQLRTFAQYLILDADANIVLRVSGGKKLPEFQDDLRLALSPKTSLLGTTRRYEAGKRDRETLFHYFRALRLAGLDADRPKMLAVGREYWQQLKEKERFKPDNWSVFTSLFDSSDAPEFAYFAEQKARFASTLGDSVVNGFAQSLFYAELSDFAAGTRPYDAARLMELYIRMQRADLPADAFVRRLYDIAKLRGEQRYEALIDYFRTHGEALRSHRLAFELTFEFSQMSETQKKMLIAYLRERAQEESEGNAKHLEELAARLDRYQGIVFEESSFEQALSKASQSGKLVFIDFFTTWCGPCKTMSREVFPLRSVGAAVNPHFVSMKIDAEKGEGAELARRYGVSAYPTMVVLSPDGTLRKSIVGARSAEQFIEEITAARPTP